jgi:molybdate transport system substrate-binding protein
MKKQRTSTMTYLSKVFILMTFIVITGCSGKKPATQTVTVFAAASTTNAITDIAVLFKEKTGIEVTTNFASSSTLAQQIESGADADVFISANEKWADYLEEKHFSSKRESILGNRIVIAAPEDSDIAGDSPEVLLSPKIKNIAMGDPSGVPAGKYGKEALVKLGLWEQIESKVIAAKDVRSALAYIETNSAEAGIVYSTDAAITDKVKVVFLFPEEATDKPISYPAMILEQALHKDNAAEFFEFLKTQDARKIFEKYGFITK